MGDFMLEELSQAQRERLYTLWDVAQADAQYKEMLLDMRELEKRYEEVYAKLSCEDRDTLSDYVSLCEGMSWRILEIASQKMVFRFEREE